MITTDALPRHPSRAQPITPLGASLNTAADPQNGIAPTDEKCAAATDRLELAIAVAAQRFSPRAILLFGSCLSPLTRRAGSIPDLFAFVDDLDATLARAGASRIVRIAARVLPPLTLSLRTDGGEELAKLNLVEPQGLAHQLATLPDLYLAGRLSKHAELVHAPDPLFCHELDSLLDSAARAMVRLALLCPPRCSTVDETTRRTFDLSYLAELRPETAARRDALFAAFAPSYRARFGPHLAAAALERGLTLNGDLLVDERPHEVRAHEAAVLRRILYRSRLRTAARWPKQALVYRGWLPYLIAKLRRARAA